MKSSCYPLLIVTGVIALACNGGQIHSNQTPDTPATLSSEDEELLWARLQDDGINVTVDEIERGDNYSLLKFDIGDMEDTSAFGSSEILGRFAYEIAKERSFKFFIVADPSGGETDLMKVYFTNDTNIPLKELVGGDYSEDLQEVFDDVGYVAVSMFDMIYRDSPPLDRERPTSTEPNRTETAPVQTPQSTASPPGEEPGEIRVFADMEFVWIPAGTFEMGSALSAEEVQRRYEYPDSEAEWWADEHPRRTVNISKGFWLGRFEITNRDYKRFAPDHDSGERDGIDLNGDDLPVVRVSWLDVHEYIGWLNEQGAGTFRLPTEAEWEYACRAGTTSVVYWGDLDESSGQYANVADRSLLEHRPDWVTVPTTDGYVMSAPVGTFKPNAWGLYDMIGNVREYCNDWWGPYGVNAQTDPKGPKSGDLRVARGGSAWSYPPACRSAARDCKVPHDMSRHGGFRLTRDPE